MTKSTPIETLRMLARRYHSDSVHALVNHTAHDLASCGNEICIDAREALSQVEAVVAAGQQVRDSSSKRGMGKPWRDLDAALGPFQVRS